MAAESLSCCAAGGNPPRRGWGGGGLISFMVRFDYVAAGGIITWNTLVEI